MFYFYKYCAVRLQAIISRVAKRVVYKIILLLMIELVDRTNKKKVWMGVFSNLIRDIKNNVLFIALMINLEGKVIN